MESSKVILVLGSGMMVEPLVDYLLKNPQNRIIIGTNMLHTALKLKEKRSDNRIECVEIDVANNTDKLRELMRGCQLVVSYVPPFLHTTVAEACLVEKRNMITTSYVSDSMMKLEPKVKEAGLIFMNEIGLDPGLDHLVTHKVIHEAEKRGDKIVHYESWCGALCSPEFLNNPILYKFTWAPRGALIALKNNAQQFLDGEIIKIPSNELLENSINKNFHECFNFEGYYNRDSLPYKELYKLKDAKTVIRGTIRYKGFTFIFQCFKHLGFFNEDKIDMKLDNWRNYFSQVLFKDRDVMNSIEGMHQTYNIDNQEFFISAKDNQVDGNAETEFYYDLALFALSKFSPSYINEHGFTSLFQKIYASLKHLDFYSEDNKIKADTILDSFAITMEEKLKFNDWERDLVFMQNEFKLISKDGKLVQKKYDLVVFGKHNNLPYSAVSLLVSLPCAITAQLILDGRINQVGVLRPSSEVIINSVFSELKKENVYLSENVEKRAKF